MELNIERDKEIDPDQLDVEWMEQPNLFYKYSDALDKVTAIRNNCKLNVEIQEKKLESLKADLELSIRNDPNAYDLDKVTDAPVKATVLVQPEYKMELERLFSLKQALNKAQNDVNSLFTAVNTISEKKTALGNLGGLLNQQYFASPSIPRNLKKEYSARIESKQISAKEKVKQRMRRRSE